MLFAASRSRRPWPNSAVASPRRRAVARFGRGGARACSLAAIAAVLILPGGTARLDGSAGGAPITTLDRSAVERAVALGRSSDAAGLDRFYAAYRVDISDALLDRLDIITPFRRVVSAAAEHALQGDRGWGVEQALDLAAASRDRVSIAIDVRFSPQNVLVAMPPFDIVLYDRPGSAVLIEPVAQRSTPRDAAGVAVSPGSPLVRGTIEATFDLRKLDPLGAYLVGIRQQGRELRRIEINLGKVE
jgi:hypothetical protein